VATEVPQLPDERPQRRREYSGAGSTLGLAALIILVVGGLVWWFEFRGGDGAEGVSGEGLGVVPLAEELNPTGRAPAGRIDRAAPDFRLANLVEGESPVLLSGFRGDYVLLNFWASWCGPCRAETPALQQFSERMAGRSLVVVGVNQQETPATARGFAEGFGVSYPMALDRDGDVSVAYSVSSGLPISMLIGPDGVIERIFRGALAEEDFTSIENDVDSLSGSAP
jgi:thiol-disulfide isomerase/thioredoxin